MSVLLVFTLIVLNPLSVFQIYFFYTENKETVIITSYTETQNYDNLCLRNEKDFLPY